MSERFFARKAFISVALTAVAISTPICVAQGVSVNGPLELTETIRQLQQVEPVIAAAKPQAEAPPQSPNESKSLGAPDRAPVGSTSREMSSSPAINARSWDPTRNEVTRVVGALAAVIGLVLMLRVCIRRFGGGGGGVLGGHGAGRPSGVVEILARYPLGGRGQQLVVLKLARRVLLLHQSGATTTTLAEVSDQQEVAGLLARMEAGSTERNAAKFRNTLAEFMREATPAKTTDRTSTARTVLPKGEAEIIDLTRSQGGFFKSLFNGRSA